MERISEEILAEILSRLPAKSLMCLKCVSKNWNSLISSPSFTKLHLKHHVGASSCQKIIKSYPTQSIDYEAFDRDDLRDEKEAIRLLSFAAYDSEEDSDCAVLIGSCNGLICLKLDGDFILCNPCTGKSRRFQDSGLIPNEDVVSDFYGFGYDAVSDDYKILYGARPSDVSKQSVAVVFSLKSNSWRRIGISHEHAEQADFGGVYLNGALHWYDKDRKFHTILSFDLADEKFKHVVPAPKVDFEGLGIHEGQLFIYRVTWESQFKAWIMKEDENGDSSWTKWFDVSGDKMPWYEFYMTVIASTKSGKMVCQFDERLMVLFNLVDQTFKEIPVELNDGFQPMATYIESLISPFD